MSICFKTPRERQEFFQLYEMNKDLFGLVDQLGVRICNNFRKDLTLTSIHRTKEENDALYTSTPPEQRPKGSPHCFWKAVDFRSRDFEEHELADIIAWVNGEYKNPNGKITCFVHKIEAGAVHAHIQYKLT